MNETLKEIPGVTTRAMFGGYGLYKEGVIFGLIAKGEIYFKVDATNMADYQSAGSEPFTYQGSSGKPVVMSYWRVPSHVLKKPTELLRWIQKSVSINSKKSTKRPSRAKT